MNIYHLVRPFIHTVHLCWNLWSLILSAALDGSVAKSRTRSLINQLNFINHVNFKLKASTRLWPLLVWRLHAFKYLTKAFRGLWQVFVVPLVCVWIVWSIPLNKEIMCICIWTICWTQIDTFYLYGRDKEWLVIERHSEEEEDVISFVFF